MIQNTSKDIVRGLEENATLMIMSASVVRSLLDEDTLSYDELKKWTLFLVDNLESNVKIIEGAIETIELLSKLP